jgi:UDP-N-acetylmuramoylalanine--D-glutamate ligase
MDNRATTDVKGKRVLIVGLARSGLAAAAFFRLQGAVVTVTDLRPAPEFSAQLPSLLAQEIGMELGVHREESFLNQELIVVSPGVPWDLAQLQAAREHGIPVYPEVEVASWFLKGTLVGITGTNGKTTTTTLLGKMLEASGFPTFVGGNIGVPLISAADRIPEGSMFVAELSSFQLEAVQDLQPHVAVLLNLTPNHLDRHSSFEAYVSAKAQIFRNQTAQDCAILNADDPNVMALAPAIASTKIFFSRRQELPDGVFAEDDRVVYRVRNLERTLLRQSDVRLRGDFNLENVLAASAAACVLGADFEAVREAVREFPGVEHRLEFVREIVGVQFYNDSKATSVDATAKALSAFEGGVHLILGGKDKGAPYEPLRPLIKSRVKGVFLIGEAAERIAQQLEGASEFTYSGDLETAVRQAFERAEPGEVVLLAPACASFDQFRDYEDRGRAFKDIVELLARKAKHLKLGDPGTWSQGGRGPEPGTGSRGRETTNRAAGTANREPLVRTQGPTPESRAGAPVPSHPGPEYGLRTPGPEIPNVRSSMPESPEAAPERRHSSSIDLIGLYEVAAEEISPPQESFSSGGDDVLTAYSVQELRPLEKIHDDPLPFEFAPAAAAAQAGLEDFFLSAPDAAAGLRRGARRKSQAADLLDQSGKARKHGSTT